MVRQRSWWSGRVPGRRGAGWRWVGLWLEVDSSAPCGRCEDATRAVRSWRDGERWFLGVSVLCDSTRGWQWIGGSGGRVVVVGQGVPAAARAPLVRALLAEAMTCHKQPRSRSSLTVECRPDLTMFVTTVNDRSQYSMFTRSVAESTKVTGKDTVSQYRNRIPLCPKQRRSLS